MPGSFDTYHRSRLGLVLGGPNLGNVVVGEAASAPPNLVTADEGIIIEPGEKVTVTLEAVVDDPLDAGITEFVNTATVSSDHTPEISDDDTNTPTAVTIGRIDIEALTTAGYLAALGGVDAMGGGELLALLAGWDADLAASLAGADRAEIMAALVGYLDPDGDGQVAVLRWETLEERGTIGFYVDRKEAGADDGAWRRINDGMLSGLIDAPLGGLYLLADPEVQPGRDYLYRLTEQEAWGSRKSYGPYPLSLK